MWRPTEKTKGAEKTERATGRDSEPSVKGQSREIMIAAFVPHLLSFLFRARFILPL